MHILALANLTLILCVLEGHNNSGLDVTNTQQYNKLNQFNNHSGTKQERVITGNYNEASNSFHST